MSGSYNVTFPRMKINSKLSTRIDADGNEVEVEVREDEEQKIKLQEIIDLLVAAGYFRARIKGLSAFDKVIGGMTWCIETSNFDVDVDLLFRENLTIGQKIALTEKIVSVLPEMKCPHRIEPHQIQGLDFIHIFPVIQWLVKKSIETREEMGDFTRSFAINQFDKQYIIPEEHRLKTQQQNMMKNIKVIKDVYRPQRRFRRKDAPPDEEESRVQSTLLEYGYHLAALSAVIGDSEESQTSEEGRVSSPEEKEAQKLEEQKIKTLMKSMASAAEQEGKLTAGVVGSIVSLQASEIAKAAERYAELQSETEEVGSSHSRALTAIQRQKVALEERESKLTAEKDMLEEAVQKEYEKLQSIKTAREKVETELADIETLETEENQGILKKLQTLVIMNENLKQQETEFREQCKAELARLQKLVKEAEESAVPGTDNDHIIKQLEEEQERVSTLRLQLAKRNRSIAALQRQLDEVPGRAELAQYQRRFLELYNQVGAKHKETKQFYTLYNTLDDTKLYLNKELTLLNSILDNYTEAMSSLSGKEQFIKQFEHIVEGVKQNKEKS